MISYCSCKLIFSTITHHVTCYSFLRLSYCRITTRGCSILKTGLLPNLPNLRVLDLSENSLREAGIKILASYVKHQHCKLEILRSVAIELNLFKPL